MKENYTNSVSATTTWKMAYTNLSSFVAFTTLKRIVQQLIYSRSSHKIIRSFGLILCLTFWGNILSPSWDGELETCFLFVRWRITPCTKLENKQICLLTHYLEMKMWVLKIVMVPNLLAWTGTNILFYQIACSIVTTFSQVRKGKRHKLRMMLVYEWL